MTKRLSIRIFIAVALVVIGFIMLIRSCLAKYDERASVGGSGNSPQFLVFVGKDSAGENNGEEIVFSLVKYDRTTSYSRQGGMTRRSVRTIYFAQTNDMGTAKKTKTQKIKKHSQIKAYPVELLGAAGGLAWLFAGELLAYDPFTLTKMVDVAKLEEKNPTLKGKLINERKYYEFDNDEKQITITTSDGVVYELNTNSLTVAEKQDEKTANNIDKRKKELDELEKDLREANGATFDRLRKNNREYQEKRMSLDEYRDSARVIGKETQLLRKQIDSINVVKANLRTQEYADDDTRRRKENARRNGGGFSSMKLNSDTLGGRWYGLYTNDELEKLNDRFDHRTLHNDAARNKLFSAVLMPKDSYWTIHEQRAETGNVVFLQGGFLINKETGLPFHLQQDFLVVYKDKIGSEGLVQLARISTNGKQLWSVNSGLKEFYDWQLMGNKLIIAGTDNKNLSSGEVNILQIINLQNGGVATYDFFKDKLRAGK